MTKQPGRRPPNCCRSIPAAAAAAVGLVDGDVAAVQLLSIHVLDGLAHRLVVHKANKTEPARSSRLMIVDDLEK